RFGATTLTTAPNGGYVVAKISSVGNWQWVIGSSDAENSEVHHGISVAPVDPGHAAAGVYVALDYRSSGAGRSITLGNRTIALPDALYSGMLVARLSMADGTVNWLRAAGSQSGLVQPNGIDVDPFGNVWVGGSFGATTTFTGSATSK